VPTPTPEMQACIDSCQACHATCLGMAMTHCLHIGGEHTEPVHFTLMMSCATICQTAADFMLMGSPHHPHVCRECAEICEECAEDCARLDGMEACVEACRRCAEECRRMAA